MDKSKRNYTQRFRSIWKKDPRLKNWLEEDPDNSQKAFCKFCKLGMQAKLSDLLSHLETKKHHKAADEIGAAVYDVFANYISEDDDNTDAEGEEDDSSIPYEEVQQEDMPFEVIQKDDEEDFLVERLHDEENDVTEEYLDVKDEFVEEPNKRKRITSPIKKDIVKPKEKCRVCMDEHQTEKMHNMFAIDSTEVLRHSFFGTTERLKINEKVEYCCGVRILQAPNLPNKICTKCFDMVRIWFNFRQVCLKSQLYLESLGKQSTEEEDDETYLQKMLHNLQNFRSKARNRRAGYDIDLIDAVVADANADYVTNDDIQVEYTICKSEEDDEVSMEQHEETPIEVLPLNFDEESLADGGEAADATQSDSEEETTILQMLKQEKMDETEQIETEEAPMKKVKKIKTPQNKNHYRYRPTSPESYMCSICGNVYNKKATFMHHMNQHSNIKPHECEICGKTYRQVSQLKNHMRRHTGEKPYKCTYCDRHFIDRSERHRHERTHTNTRPYVCNVCGKSFMYSAILKNHQKLHSGEKNYNCLVCHKSFTLQHHLKAHLQTLIHKQKEEQYISAGYEVVYD